MPTSGVTVHRRHNDAMSARAPQEPAPLSEREMHQLQDRLDAVPEPLQALDVSALDGFLCGMLLLPQDVPAATWLPYVTDLEGGALPPGFDAAPLHALVLRRHAELRRAIAARQWFDPGSSSWTRRPALPTACCRGSRALRPRWTAFRR